MSIDLALTPQSPAPAVAPRIEKGANAPLETQQALRLDEGDFRNLLSAMDGESGFQAERPSTRTPGSDPQKLREGKPEPAPEPSTPSDTNGAPKGFAPLTANASLVNLTWPALFARVAPQETLPKADGAADSNPGQATNGEGHGVSLNDDAGASPARIFQRRSVEQTLAADGERPPTPQVSFPLEAQLAIDGRRQQGRPENTVVMANVLQQLSIEQTLARDDEPPPISQRSFPSDTQLAIDAARHTGRPATLVPTSSETIQHETIQHVTVSSLETHFPVALSSMLVKQGRISNNADDQGLSISQASFPLDAQPEIEASRPQGRAENTVVTKPAETVPRGTLQQETIQQVTISSLETNFPVVLSNMLVEHARISNDAGSRSANILIASAPQIDEARPQIAAPTKILKIELEPASLGTVTVRMKVSRSNVDVQIKVDSAQALDALNNTRDKLVEAIRSSGCTVDSCTVGFTPASAGNPQPIPGGGQNLAASRSETRSHANIGQGADHGSRDDNPKEDRRNPWEGRPDSGSSRSADRNHGLYL